MTAPNRARRTCGWAAALGIALGFGVVPGALAADPPAPQSRLESPMADLAVIPSAPGSSADTTPDLLVLDEPFGGLDVNAGLLFRTLLGMLAAEGCMILFSTHRFDMVEKLCSRVVILSTGRIVAEQDVAAFATAGTPSLEDTFMQVTRQTDFRPLAKEILDTIRA